LLLDSAAAVKDALLLVDVINDFLHEDGDALEAVVGARPSDAGGLLVSGPRRTRTCNLGIKSPLLCQLS
jgi:hypothetical protein